MNVTKDKVLVDPPHARYKADVRRILAAAMGHRLEGIITVRLSAGRTSTPLDSRLSL